MKLRKLLAKIFVIIATFFVVLSPIVLVEEADHSCSHTDDCQICEVIRTAEENFKQLNYTPASTAAVVLIPIVFILALAIIATSKSIDSNTLVSLKTKLSN